MTKAVIRYSSFLTGIITSLIHLISLIKIRIIFNLIQLKISKYKNNPSNYNYNYNNNKYQNNHSNFNNNRLNNSKFYLNKNKTLIKNNYK
jgi:hypothetical protein